MGTGCAHCFGVSLPPGPVSVDSWDCACVRTHTQTINVCIYTLMCSVHTDPSHSKPPPPQWPRWLFSFPCCNSFRPPARNLDSIVFDMLCIVQLLCIRPVSHPGCHLLPHCHYPSHPAWAPLPAAGSLPFSLLRFNSVCWVVPTWTPFSTHMQSNIPQWPPLSRTRPQPTWALTLHTGLPLAGIPSLPVQAELLPWTCHLDTCLRQPTCGNSSQPARAQKPHTGQPTSPGLVLPKG